MPSMEGALRAIAEPRRREILRLIWDAELAAGEIAAHFEVTRPAISQHLRVLKDAGLVAERRDGTHRFYRADPAELAELRPVLERYWGERLALLKQASEAEERKSGQHGDRRED
jgi:DNA-binding transcriptional ArsR family regulator